ncbi:MAG: MarR family transcriptional regulator [Gammaproteobacteria bacterium]|nr:MarR family transcriptional regulator [Gammaproteobacteria bacterium]MDH3375334.1 MarR family transcriptional regulator [Gammaproteobacteria bacterium]MDH3409358.1 MarR family transcriptional regulator [Gammaproteobacteria bacterium]
MSEQRNQQAYQITWLIRRLFRAMASEADRYLADAELSAADRAVMEFLYPDIELSVPEIARRYNVSRQHVQVTVNALCARGLLRRIENPKHKRSRLIRLSEPGRNTFAEIRRNEAVIVERLFNSVSHAALETTHTTLTKLLQQLT